MKGRPWHAQGDELVRVDRSVAGVLAARPQHPRRHASTCESRLFNLRPAWIVNHFARLGDGDQAL